MNILKMYADMLRFASPYVLWNLDICIALLAMRDMAKQQVGCESKDANPIQSNSEKVNPVEAVERTAEDPGEEKNAPVSTVVTISRDNVPQATTTVTVPPTIAESSPEGAQPILEPEADIIRPAPSEKTGKSSMLGTPIGERPSLRWKKAKLLSEAKSIGLIVDKTMTKKKLLRAIEEKSGK